MPNWLGARTLNTEYRNLFKRAWMGIEYALRGTGPLTMAPSQVGAFARSSPRYATANLEFHFQPLSLDRWGDGLHPFGAQGLSGPGPKAGGPHSLHRFATERTLTVNTAAVGGNASLLSLTDE